MPRRDGYTPIELCDGFLQVANANMVKAIQSISIAKGCDPRDYVLVAFGGAAGQHACAVADELGMREVLLHPDAGILERLRHRRWPMWSDIAARGVYQLYSQTPVRELATAIRRIDRSRSRRGAGRRDFAGPRRGRACSLDLRYQGLDAWLTIPEPTDGTIMRHAYAAEHEKLYGYRSEERAVEIVAARVEVVGHTAARRGSRRRASRRGRPCS